MSRSRMTYHHTLKLGIELFKLGGKFLSGKDKCLSDMNVILFAVVQCRYGSLGIQT